MLMRDYKAASRALQALWLISTLSFGLSACGAPIPSNCITQNRGCDILTGSYDGFTIGMSKEAAFKNACEREHQGKWVDQRPLFFTNDGVTDYKSTSMCASQSNAMLADQWVFVEPSALREQFVSLHFDKNSLSKINLQLRGWDP